MPKQEDVVITIVWCQDSDEKVADPKDEVFDARGRRWIVSYYPSYDGTIQCSLEEALKIARSSPTGDYSVCCHFPHDCSSNVRDVMGDFKDARCVEIILADFEESVHKTTISLAGIEEFRRLECLKLVSYGGKPRRHQVDLCLEGIEFCGNLKHLTVKCMTIPTLEALGHLELETLQLMSSSVNDLSMVRARRLFVDAEHLPLVRRALEPPCIVQTIYVESVEERWEILIEMEELQTELENRLRTEPQVAVVTRYDLFNSLERGQVILTNSTSRKTMKELKISAIRNFFVRLTCDDYRYPDKGWMRRDLDLPIITGDECLEVRDILNRLAWFNPDDRLLTFKELRALFDHFQFKVLRSRLHGNIVI